MDQETIASYLATREAELAELEARARKRIETAFSLHLDWSLELAEREEWVLQREWQMLRECHRVEEQSSTAAAQMRMAVDEMISGAEINNEVIADGMGPGAWAKGGGRDDL